jgi:hypothetical protein
MMSRVLVTAINGSNITCSDGSIRSAIGMGRVCVGDALWGNGDFVLSPGGAPASRPPIVWEDVSGYRFADAAALMMVFVDKKFSKVIKTKTIIPPEENAKLLLHCYNSRNEYLVWFNGGRCIIEKNGAAANPFDSAFPEMPETSDAYIDDDGDLIWVALATSYSLEEGEYCVIARYKNGTCEQVKNDFVSAAAAALDDLRISVAGTIAELVASANFSLSFTHSAETSVTYSEWAARKMYFEGDSLYKDGSGGSLYCVSLSGYSGRDEPIWPDTAGQTVSDGDVVWRFHPWVPYANPYQILAETCSTGVVYDNSEEAAYDAVTYLGAFLWSFEVAARFTAAVYSGQLAIQTRLLAWDYPGQNLVGDATAIAAEWRPVWFTREFGTTLRDGPGQVFVTEQNAIPADGAGGLALRNAAITSETKSETNLDDETILVNYRHCVDVINYYDTFISATVPGSEFTAGQATVDRALNDEVSIRQVVAQVPEYPQRASSWAQWDALRKDGADLMPEMCYARIPLIGAPWSLTDNGVVGIINGFPESGINIVKATENAYSPSVADVPLQTVVTKRFI